MTAVFMGNFETGSPDWWEARRNGLGGSEIAAVLGLSRFESPFGLWHRKSGALGAIKDTPLLEAGRRIEPVVCQWFADNHPEVAVHATGMWRHAERPWQIASPDRLVSEPRAEQPAALLEAKLALYDDEWGEPGTDEIPPGYLIQTRWYLDVFGVDTCWVAVFIGSSADFRLYVVHPSDEDTTLMRAEAQAYLDTIRAGERPPIDGHNATYEAVRQLHPDIDGTRVELDPEVVGPYVRAKRACRAARHLDLAATSAVADAMGSAQRGTYAGYTIASRQARGDGPPYVVATRNLPDLGIFPDEDEDSAA